MRANAKERAASVQPGLQMLVVTILLVVVGVGIAGASASTPAEPVSAAQGVGVAVGIVMVLLGTFLALGLFIVQPNQAVVILLFGRYIGTTREDGWYWANPFTIGQRRKISLRIRNFDSQKVKVNDARGNPVEIAAVVAWKVVDTAKAVFDVDDYTQFVAIQSETAVRHLATQYPYDSYEDAALSLSGNVDDVSRSLQEELEERLSHAGVNVVEARLSHLSYAPEIAGAMLRRQQATAIVAARQTMVEGAVGMVDMALQRIAAQNIVQLDEEKKAAMISNLLVVLTGDQAVHPVVNAGTLYQ